MVGLPRASQVFAYRIQVRQSSTTGTGEVASVTSGVCLNATNAYSVNSQVANFVLNGATGGSIGLAVVLPLSSQLLLTRTLGANRVTACEQTITIGNGAVGSGTETNYMFSASFRG